VTTASSATVASGSVISSSPVAATQVTVGSSVNLVVSTGPAQVAVPNVVGLTQAAATTALTGAGLAVGTVTTASSATVASGSVISSSPVAATQVTVGSSVNLVVSTGLAQVAVPSVVGLTQAAATAAITGAGLVVGTVTTASSSAVASGSVISESPVAATQVNVGSSVNLVVSTGPPPFVSITINTAPSGLSFSADGVSYASTQVFQWAVGSTHAIGATTPQTSTSGQRFDFTGWSDGGAAVHNVTTPATATTYTAAFNNTSISQTIDFPPIPDQTFGNPPFAIAATASSGLPVAFNIMSGPAAVNGNIITLTGVGAVTVDASQPGNSVFAPAVDVVRTFRVLSPNFSLFLTASPAAGGAIFAAPSGGVYVSGTSVQIAALPNTGFIFTGFSGDLSGLANPQSVLMSQNRSVTANFAALSNASQDQAAFGFQAGNPLPGSQTVPLSSGSTPPGVLSVQIVPGTGGNWLTAALTPAANPTAVQLSVVGSVVTGLATGSYFGYAVVNTASGQRVLTVKLLVNSMALSGIADSAGYQSRAFASGELMTVFGINEATQTAQASSLPLPASLGGTYVVITDSAGVARSALLLYVSPTQINLLTPSGMAAGPGFLTVVNGSNQQATLNVAVGAVSPGIFSADTTGQGVAAAVVQIVAANGTAAYSLAANCGPAGACPAVPIDVSNPAQQVYLSLYGTGIRGRSALSQVIVTVGGAPVQVLYAGLQSQYPGLDQINILLPASLAGKGAVSVATTVDGQPANTVGITLK
jgi:uncharacterized protein (TIGR03437 family)